MKINIVINIPNNIVINTLTMVVVNMLIVLCFRMLIYMLKTDKRCYNKEKEKTKSYDLVC